jgi:hypothetical protein
MKNIKFLSSLFALVFILGLFLPFKSFAGSYGVSPLIIDIEADARDSSVHDIKVKNFESNYVRLYATVNEIEVGDDNVIKEFISPSMSDRSESITSWIEITRGRIELSGGEEKNIPLTIRVNHNAKPGLYHAFVGFAGGHNRDAAEETIRNGQGEGVILRILVGSKQEEFLRLVSFTTDKFSFIEGRGTMTYVLENTGDIPLKPSGDITIYDGRGKELTAIDISSETENSLLQPGELRTYTKDLPYTDRLGRNKAFLNVEYGEVNRAAVYDTNFYFSIPWIYGILIVLLLLLVLITFILIIKRGRKERGYEPGDVHDLPMYVGQEKNHTEYEHDINLKNKKL